MDWHAVKPLHDMDAQFPTTLAAKIPAGKQLVLQSYHLNTSEAPLAVQGTVDLYLTNPVMVQAYTEILRLADLEFEVPPLARAQSVTTCTIPSALKVVMLNGHMHQFGTYYRLEVIDGSGQPLETLYEEVWGPSSPWTVPRRRYPIDAPLELAAGTRLRQTCQWDNPTERSLRHPREMCLAVLAYLATEQPPLDQKSILCVR